MTKIHISSKGCADRYSNTKRGEAFACRCAEGKCWVDYARAMQERGKEVPSFEEWRQAGAPKAVPHDFFSRRGMKAKCQRCNQSRHDLRDLYYCTVMDL